ncbi:MAG: hypothetical protein COB37_00610 [Kordiimonadales bacterium]|nr:MAG: hypothetical protein COB37_00610 [Kordiimonadales bacterium]
MQKSSVLAVAIAIFSAALFTPQLPVSAKDDKPPFREYLNKRTSPAENFFKYATGNWPVKVGRHPSFEGADSLTQLGVLNAQKLDKTLTHIRNNGTDPTSQLIQTFMQSVENTEALKAAGLTPLKNKLAEIDGAENFTALMIASADPAFGLYGPLVHAVQPSRTDPNKHSVYIATYGFSLPQQVFFSNSGQAKSIRIAHEALLAFLLEQTGEPQARALARHVMTLEENLAHLLATDTEGSGRSLVFTTVEALAAENPALPWTEFFKAARLPIAGPITVVGQKRLVGLSQLAEDTALLVWKAYYKTQLLIANKAYLPPRIEQAAIVAAKTYEGGGTFQPTPAQKTKIEANQWFSEYIGHRFAADHVSATTRTKITEMTTAIKAAFKERIQSSSVFTAETRAFALKKLDAMRAEIAEPSWPLDYSGLAFEPTDLFGNIMKLRLRDRALDAETLKNGAGGYVRWNSPAYTTNALYSPNQNAILLPAGFMQTPLYYPGADDAYNYGSFGTIIGHEIAHAFDNRGRQFGADGAQVNWWQPEDIKKFNTLSEILVNQYEAYARRTGTTTNARRTLGENIADIIGIQIAYDAYMANRTDGAEVLVNGFTEQQRFYLGLAQKRRARTRSEDENAILALDTHSHGAIRLNGALRNIDSWFEAFKVGKDDFLYLTPEKRVSFW